MVIPSGRAAERTCCWLCADEFGAVAESNEANKCVASAGTVQVGLPDLVETTVSNPAAAALAGSFFAVRWWLIGPM